MIKLRNLCLRLSSLGLAACLIFALCFPVSATIYDYWDLDPTLEYLSDGNTLVTIDIPSSLAYSRLLCSDGVDLRGGSSVSYTLPRDVSAQIRFYSFGYPSVVDLNSLNLNDIPSGTHYQILFSLDAYPALYNTTVSCFQQYFDASGNLLSERMSSISATSGSPILFDLVIDKPNGADSLVVYFYQYFQSQPSERTLSYRLISSTLSMTLDSLIVQQQQTGRTNSILQKVEQQLADQGQTLDDVLKEQQDTNDKLDDIINGTVEPSSPAGSDSVGDLTDQEDQLLQDMNPGFDAMDDLQADVLEQIVGYAMSLNAVSWLLDRFISIPFIYIILAISLSLGLTGTILGLFNTIASRYRSDARDRKNELRRAQRMIRYRRKGG